MTELPDVINHGISALCDGFATFHFSEVPRHGKIVFAADRKGLNSCSVAGHENFFVLDEVLAGFVVPINHSGHSSASVMARVTIRVDHQKLLAVHGKGFPPSHTERPRTWARTAVVGKRLVLHKFHQSRVVSVQDGLHV